eukprot:1159952-Pelagomonas_calceolata.AAC.8
MHRHVCRHVQQPHSQVAMSNETSLFLQTNYCNTLSYLSPMFPDHTWNDKASFLSSASMGAPMRRALSRKSASSSGRGIAFSMAANCKPFCVPYFTNESSLEVALGASRLSVALDKFQPTGSILAAMQSGSTGELEQMAQVSSQNRLQGTCTCARAHVCVCVCVRAPVRVLRVQAMSWQDCIFTVAKLQH